MKKALLSLAALGLLSLNANAAVVVSDDFSSVLYTSSVTEFTDDSFDYWKRTDGSDISGVYNGASGSFFAGMDIDGEGATLPLSITWSGLNTSAFNDQLFTFSVDLAEDDDGANQDFDATDYVAFFYKIDSGAEVEAFRVTGSGTNTEPSINGAGTQVITDTFTTFTFADVATLGNTLDLRVEWNLDAGDEDLAIDNIQVTAVPEPSTYAAIFGVLILGLAISRRRK